MHLPTTKRIEYLAKLRVAKARASDLARCMRNSLQRAERTSKTQGKTLYFSEAESKAFQVSGKYFYGTTLAYGDKEQFQQDSNYTGELRCLFPSDTSQPIKWLTMPEDDRILLSHTFLEEEGAIHATVEASQAYDLGITEVLVKGEYAS